MKSTKQYLRLVIPFEVRQYEVYASCRDVMAHISSIVRGPFWFANYWKCKGEFIGRVEFNRFRLARWLRTPYVPVVSGEVTSHPKGCRVKLRFSGYQPILPILAAWLPVVIWRTYGAAGGVIIALGIAGLHVAWCINQRREIAIFLHAAGIEIGEPRGIESFWNTTRRFPARRVFDADD